MFKSLKAGMLVRYITVIMAAIIPIGILGAYFSFMSSEKTLEQTLSETARIAAGQVESNLSESLTVIKEIGMNPLLASADVDSRSKLIMLKNRADRFGFVEYGYTTTSGITPRGTSYSALEWFKRSIEGEVYLCAPQNRADGSYVMYISAPIIRFDEEYNETIAGVVYAAVDATYLSNISGNIKVGEGGSAFILDHEGTVIAHDDYSKVTSEENLISIFEAPTDGVTDLWAEDAAAKKEQMAPYQELEQLEKQALSLADGETLFGSCDFDGSTKCVAMSKIAGTEGWVIAIQAEQDEFTGQSRLCVIITIIVAVIVLILAALFIVHQTGRIVKPIKEINTEMTRVAEGDLSVAVIRRTKDEVGDLADKITDTVTSLKSYVSEISRITREISDGKFNFTSDVEFRGDFIEVITSLKLLAASLSQTMENIDTAAEQVNTGATQISDGAQSLAQGTTKQAASVDDLSSAVAQLDSHVRINAENAEEASVRAVRAGERITASNERMKDMIKAMENISVKSSEINNIIATIDDIAFQTNILALNAAIEAARAGDAGKGFAVVADEVRNLAAKSAKAAQSTTNLINQSLNAVDEGSAIADETAESLRSSVAITNEAVGLINEISAASRRQAEMINDVNRSIEQITAVVQTNAAAAEESAASGEELNSQATELRNLTGRFSLMENSAEYLAEYEEELRRIAESEKQRSAENAPREKLVINLDDEPSEPAESAPEAELPADTEQPVQPEKPEKPKKIKKPWKSRKAKKNAKPEEPEQPAESEQPVQSEQPEQAVEAEQPVQPEKSAAKPKAAEKAPVNNGAAAQPWDDDKY